MIQFCSLFSGSSGNALVLSCGNTNILIDAGVSTKGITEALNDIGLSPADICAILVSHEHSDHVRGVGTFSRRYGIPVYANVPTWEAMEPLVGEIEPECRQVFQTDVPFEIGEIGVHSFRIPHDAREPVGFNFYMGTRKVTVATDMGHIFPGLMDRIKGSDLLFLESNHDVQMLLCGPYPWFLKQRILGQDGHLSNDSAARLVRDATVSGTRQVMLGHLSKENNFPELAYQTVCSYLYENGIRVGEDVSLDVAGRDRRSRVVNL